MFSRIRNFFSRHRQKFVVGGVIVGGTILLSRYVQKLLREWQEKETKELLERAKKQQHYESIERTCNQTALTMATNLKDTIIKMYKTEELVQLLKDGAQNKIILWQSLKIMAFTKLSVLVYASTLLIVTLRIQLNLIGGYMFRDTADESDETQITSGIQERYLGLCQYFMEDGIKRLSTLIEEKITLVMAGKSLKEKLSIHDMEQIFWAIQSSIGNDCKDPCKNLAEYILPKTLKRESYGSHVLVFDKIIAETNDLLESDEIVHLTESCISRGFSYIMDQVADYFIQRENIGQAYFSPVPTTSSAPDIVLPAKSADVLTDINKVVIPLAKVIPIVNGLVQSHTTKDDIPRTWIQQLILMDSLKTMGANIYETFSSKG